jgi:hypothetical protein
VFVCGGSRHPHQTLGAHPLANGDLIWALLTLAGAVLTAGVLIVCARIVHARRDVIIFGYDGDRRLTRGHRVLVLTTEWMPTALALTTLSAATAYFLYRVPGMMLLGTTWLRVLTWTITFAFAAIAAGWIIGGVFQLWMMIARIWRNEYAARVRGSDPP